MLNHQGLPLLPKRRGRPPLSQGLRADQFRNKLANTIKERQETRASEPIDADADTAIEPFRLTDELDQAKTDISLFCKNLFAKQEHEKSFTDLTPQQQEQQKMYESVAVNCRKPFH